MRWFPRLTLLLFLATPSPAHGDVVVLAPVRDNTLFQDADGDTSCGAGPAFYAGRNSQAFTRRAVIAFDLQAQVPPGAVIINAVLTLHVSSAPDTVPRRFTVHRVLREWGEGASYSSGGSGAPAAPGDATWLHTFYPGEFWATPGGDFIPASSAEVLVADVGSYSWTGGPLVDDLRAWLAAPDSNFGWLLEGEESGARTVRRFDSRETELATDRPVLTIEYAVATGVPLLPVTWGGVKLRCR